MNLPLYLDNNAPDKPGNGHHGLWFERYFNRYGPDWSIPKEASKLAWIKTVEGLCGDRAALDIACAQQENLCKSLNGGVRLYQTEWHFATGLGNSHPVENGFTWHPTLGTPYLPGSAVKGLIREWVTRWAEVEEVALHTRLHRWFGSDHKDPKRQTLESQAGQFIFFDALPVRPVQLAADVITPHMGKWYEQGGDIPEAGTLPPAAVPADWHDPVPVPFLVVKDARFQFAVAPRTETSRTELSMLFEVFDSALAFLGAGAKTAVGYGHMSALKQAVHQTSEEEWKGVATMWNKGSGILSIRHPEKGQAEIKGDDAKKIYDSLPETIRSKLNRDRQPCVDATVEMLGPHFYKIKGVRVVKT